MMNNEQIKEARITPDDEETLKADARLQDLCGLIGEIEKRPDAARRLEQAKGMLAVLAGYTVKDAHEIQLEKQEYHEQLVEAGDDLALAFVNIIDNKRFIPANHFNALMDVMSELVSDSEWESDPEVLREVLPFVLKRSLWKHRPDRLQ